MTPNGGTIFAATSDGGLMRSINGGGTWSFRNGALGNGMEVNAVAIQNSIPNTMYMVASPTFTSSVYKSANGGSSWTLANSGISGAVTFIAVDQAAPAILYASTQSNGIFKSINGGTSWVAVNTGLPRNGSFFSQFFKVIVHPTTHTTVFAVGANGIYRSTNSGTSWTALHNGIPFQDAVNDLLINPANPLQLLAAADSGVFKSINGGSSWTPTPLSSTALSLALKPGTPNTVYAGLSFGGIQVSLNFGGSWAPANTGLPSSATVMALAVNPVTQTTVFAGLAYPFGVFKTTAGAVAPTAVGTWAPANGGINQIEINTLEDIPGSTTTFLAGTNQLGVQRTVNSGGSFVNSNTGLSPFFSPQDFDFFDPTFGVVAGFGGTAFTTNQGMSWTVYTGSTAPFSGTAVQVDKTNRNHIDVLIFDGVSVTNNGGASWAERTPACFRLFTFANDFAMQPNNGMVGIMVTNTGVYRTTNDWNACTRIASGVPSFVNGVLFDPNSPGTVIVFGNGASKSTNGGANFSPMTALNGHFIASMDINPANSMDIVVAESGVGVLRSINGGTTFSPVTNTGLVSQDNFTSIRKIGPHAVLGTDGNSVPVNTLP